MHDLFVEIWESLRRNKLRTMLTGFAVSWGIFMLIVLLGAGNGLMNAFMDDSDWFASNSMRLFGGYTSKPYGGYQTDRRIKLTADDMATLKNGVTGGYIDDMTTQVNKSGLTMSFGDQYLNNVNMQGVYPATFEMDKLKMVCGRYLNDKDIKLQRKVIVIDSREAESLLGGRTDYERLLGKQVRVDSLSFKIVGILKAGNDTWSSDVDVPYSTLRTIYNMGEEVNQITFTFHGLPTEEDNEFFEAQIKTVLNNAHHAAPDDDGAIWIWNRFTQHLQMETGAGLLRTALWVIGLLTLLSGITGVSNIMLITVKERTHEFGIRKAIGARPWSVVKLIISESVTITVIFGYVGMILGLVACEIMDATVGQSSVSVLNESMRVFINPTVGMGTAVGATVVLVVAGTIAGLVPAVKASRVKPIEALNAN